jgi:hypothetical protein
MGPEPVQPSTNVTTSAPPAIRVFISSPGDVKAERDAAATVINELNHAAAVLAPEKELVLQALRWETHVYPAMGTVQDVINEQLSDYDIFIGIMWKRFGTPTGRAESGTEEEYRIAYENWKKSKRPHIMFYFSQKAVPPGRTEDAEQLLKVYQFRDELQSNGLVWHYKGLDEFKAALRSHLLQLIGGRILHSSTPRTAAERVGRAALSSDISTVKEQLDTLAAEYSSIRLTMNRSTARTRDMEGVVSRLKTLALAGYPLLARYAAAETPGERLVAIAMLEVVPDAGFVSWLAERFEVEAQPFVQYHAGLALLAAGRGLGVADRPQIKAAVQRAMTTLNPTSRTDRYWVLSKTLVELNAESRENARFPREAVPARTRPPATPQEEP